MGKQFIGVHMVPTFDTAGGSGDSWEMMARTPNNKRTYMEVVSLALGGCKQCDIKGTRDCSLAAGTSTEPLGVGDKVPSGIYLNMVQIYERNGAENVEATHAVKCTYMDVRHGDSKALSVVVGRLIRL